MTNYNMLKSIHDNSIIAMNNYELSICCYLSHLERREYADEHMTEIEEDRVFQAVIEDEGYVLPFIPVHYA